MAATRKPRKRRAKKQVELSVEPTVDQVQGVQAIPMPSPTEPVSVSPQQMTIKDRAIVRIRRDYCDLKDPSRQFMLVRDRPKERQKFERNGYTIVKPDEVADHDGWKDENDGVVRFGDRVAYKIPRDVIQHRRHERDAKQRSQTSRLRDANIVTDKYAGAGLYNTSEDDGGQSGSRSFNVPIEFQQ